MAISFATNMFVKEVNPLLGLEQFLEMFGDVTVSRVVSWIFICVLFFKLYKQVEKFVNNEIEKRKKEDEEKKQEKAKIEASYCITQKYPEYHQESIEIRAALQKEIQELRDGLQTMMKRFEEIEEKNKKRECSKLRDMLLQNYRYYTNESQNPSRSWTRMEADAFWELFSEYEEAGGNGHMHDVVQPEMERLIIIEVGK